MTANVWPRRFKSLERCWRPSDASRPGGSPLQPATVPGENYQPPTSGWLALVGVLVVIHLIQRETGVRLRTLGARAGFAVAGIIAVCLGLFSVSLGLVASGMTWAVALTSLVALGTTTWLAGIACRSAAEQLRHD